MPRMMVDMFDAWNKNDHATAMSLQRNAMPLFSALYCETNPVPVKYAASLLGFCTPEVRLPLVELSEASKAIVRKAMGACGLKVAEAA